MTSKERAAMQQALEALDKARIGLRDWELPENRYAALNSIEPIITVMREALAEQEQQGEAVAKIVLNRAGQITMQTPDGDCFDMSKHVGVTLYTAPQKREWVELSDEDRAAAFNSLPDMLDGFLKKWCWMHFANEIERRCMEKQGIFKDANE